MLRPGETVVALSGDRGLGGMRHGREDATKERSDVFPPVPHAARSWHARGCPDAAIPPSAARAA
jgi:hypothetical protein